MKKMINIGLVSCLFMGCSSQPTQMQSVEVEQPVYECKTINYYDYDEKVPTSQTVEDSYFQDTFFGGDSRMGSLYLYSNLRDLGADIQYCESLSLYRIYDMAMTDANRPLYDLLMETNRKNIYIMLGVNEIRNDDFTDWAEEYNTVIQEVKAAHPHANIYIMNAYHPRSIDGLTAEQLDAHLKMLNDALQNIAKENLCYYLDTNDGILDSSGLVSEDLTWDGLHFNVDGSQAFADEIAKHVVRRNDYVKEMCE